MENLIFYCKSFSRDFAQFGKLVETFNLYNKDNIKLVASVPENEVDIFKPFESNNIHLISDESFAKDYMFKEAPNYCSLGYANQEICKLVFFKTNLCKNYLVLDSDCLFIRDFYKSDFMYDENTPYIVLVMDKDLCIEKDYNKIHWNARQAKIKEIYDYIGLKDARLRTCHNCQVFNCAVLQDFEDNFIKPNGLSYTKLIDISAYEFSWYNAWFQKCKLIPEYAVEPFFKMFHIKEHYIFSHLHAISKDDIAKAYLGIIMNSSWALYANGGGITDYESPNESYKNFYESISNDSFKLQDFTMKTTLKIFRFALKYISRKLRGKKNKKLLIVGKL